MMRGILLSTTMLAGLTIVASVCPSQAADKKIIDLGEIEQGDQSDAFAMSADGKFVVGSATLQSVETAFRWTDAGMQSLGYLPGGGSSVAAGVSADGNIVVGRAQNAQGTIVAFRWKKGASGENDVMETIGELKAGGFSAANGVSADGKVVVGQAQYETATKLRAFRWTSGTGMMDLGRLPTQPPARSSGATAVNRDGSVIVGWSGTLYGGREAFRWVKDNGAETGVMSGLGFINGGEFSEAHAVNGDGTVVVGMAAGPDNNNHAFRWTESSQTMTDLGTIYGDRSNAKGVSADGKVVVGTSTFDDSGTDTAFRWTSADSKMISMNQWLTDNGVDLGSDVLVDATATNEDGSAVVGTLLDANQSRHAYLATDGGLMLPENFQASLSQVTGADIGIRTGEISLNGAHGKPMRSLLDEGKSSFFAAGDIGRVLQDDGDGYMGFGELGYGRGISDVLTARVAIGGFGERIEPETGGNATSRLAYVLPEFSYNASGNLYITASGYYGRGEVKTHRGYLNGAATDYSDGTADLDVWAGRIRADLKDVFTLDGTAFTPFASYSVIHSHRDAYTETGGAFPVVWDAHSDVSNVVRAGLDATHALTPAVTLLGHVEANYGFEGKTASASGTVIGLNGFETSQASLEQFGAQAGVGFEVQAGSGTASLMLNAATGGNNPAAWLAASYKVTF